MEGSGSDCVINVISITFLLQIYSLKNMAIATGGSSNVTAVVMHVIVVVVAVVLVVVHM